VNEHAVMLCIFCGLAQGGRGALVSQARGQRTYSQCSCRDFAHKHFAVYVSGEAARRARSCQVEIPAKIFAKGFPGG